MSHKIKLFREESSYKLPRTSLCMISLRGLANTKRIQTRGFS